MADDECRQNFDRQVVMGQDLDYPKDREAGSVTELVFLGAHSDIGGGYRPVHHGRNNNDLGKVYLNKMYELALENKVPFKAKATGADWKVPKPLTESFSGIQGYYKKYSDLKIAHKRFRERMGYLYDPGSNKHPSYQFPSELSRDIKANKTEISTIDTELTKLEAQLKKASGSQDSFLGFTVTKGDKQTYQDKITDAENRRTILERINKDYLKKLTAYQELEKVFAGNEDDYGAFIKVSVDFHNTYVHKSHSDMWRYGRSDYDAQGNKIPGRSRDLAGMNAEIDGRIFSDGHLHRKWYKARHINVVKKLCEREEIEKTNAEVFDGFLGTIADYATRPGRWVASKTGLTEEYTAFDWVKPEKFS